MKLGLTDDSIEKLEAHIQEIETTAVNGIFIDNNAVGRFHKIVSEAKKLRQTLREVVLLSPNGKSAKLSGDAA